MVKPKFECCLFKVQTEIQAQKCYVFVNVIYIGCKGWNTLPDRSPGFTYIATNCFVFTSWNIILSLQQATQIQTDLVLFDLSQQENSITGTKIFQKYFPVHTKWYVAAICCCSEGVVGYQNVLQQHVIYCVPAHPGFDSKPPQNK